MADKETAEVVETDATSTDDSTLSLSDMFNESEPEASEVTTVAAEAKDKDDQGEPEKTEAKAAEEPEAEPPSAEQGQLAGMLAERDKRQKAEAELRELKAKIEPEAKADPIEDPDGFREELAQGQATESLKNKIEMSQTMMTELDPDYLRLEGVFKGLIADEEGNITDDGLLRKFQQSTNPAKFARDHAKQHEEIEAMKDPKYVETLEAKIRAEVLAEIAEKAKAGVSATDVPDLTTASAAGSNSGSPPTVTTIAGMFDD